MSGTRAHFVWRNRLRGYGYSVGIRVPIDRTLLSYAVEQRIAIGRNQAAEFKCARGVVRSGDVVLELGGGLGVISAALRRETAASRIISFEANPDLLTYAKLTHQLNGASNIEVRHGVVLSRADSPYGVLLSSSSRFGWIPFSPTGFRLEPDRSSGGQATRAIG